MFDIVPRIRALETTFIMVGAAVAAITNAMATTTIISMSEKPAAARFSFLPAVCGSDFIINPFTFIVVHPAYTGKFTVKNKAILVLGRGRRQQEYTARHWLEGLPKRAWGHYESLLL
jgi:hypothetical protein